MLTCQFTANPSFATEPLNQEFISSWQGSLKVKCSVDAIGTKTQQLIGRQEYGNNKMVGTKTFQSNGRQKNTAAFG